MKMIGVLLLVALAGCADTRGLFQPTSTYVIPPQLVGLAGDKPIVVHSARNATLEYDEGVDPLTGLPTRRLRFVGDASGVIGSQEAAVVGVNRGLTENFIAGGNAAVGWGMQLAQFYAANPGAFRSGPPSGDPNIDRLADLVIKRIEQKLSGGATSAPVTVTP